MSMLCGNTAYCVKSSDDLSRYSNKIESVGVRKYPHYHFLTKKWWNKHFTQLAPHQGRKAAGLYMAWRNYTAVTYVNYCWLSCFVKVYFRNPVRFSFVKARCATHILMIFHRNKCKFNITQKVTVSARSIRQGLWRKPEVYAAGWLQYRQVAQLSQRDRATP